MTFKQLRTYAKYAPFVPLLAFGYWASWQWYVHPDFAHWLICAIPILPLLGYTWLVFWRKEL